MRKLIIDGIENDYYTADTFGNIYNIEGVRMTQHLSSNGYLRVKLSRGCKRGMYLVHRLIAQTFIDNPEQYPIVNHKDNSRDNNKVTNLEWCNNSHNQKQRFTTGGHVGTKRKQVHQYSIFGEYIRSYDSPIEAEEFTGVARQNISKVCLGTRNHAGGYRWKY